MEIINFGPFNADVWGTVSDWVMTVVTAITAIFLWLTLKSQSQVQKDQQEITKIEQFNHRRQLLPSFNLEAFTHEKADNQKEFTRVMFTLKVLNNLAKNIYIYYNTTGDWTVGLKAGKNIDMMQNDKRTFDGTLTFIPGEFHEGQIFFTFEFSDDYGTKYRQNINYLCFDVSHHISYGQPILI